MWLSRSVVRLPPHSPTGFIPRLKAPRAWGLSLFNTGSVSFCRVAVGDNAASHLQESI
jgi:hypothetical protein